MLEENRYDNFVSEPLTTVNDCELFVLRKYLADVTQEEENCAKILTPMVK